MNLRSLTRLLLDPVAILGAIFFGVALSFATLGLLWLTRPAGVPIGVPTAGITIVVLPNLADTSSPSTPSASGGPTDTPAPSSRPGEISIGAFVQVTGTGGDGLRLRSEPGLDGKVLLIGREAEVFEVHEGPKEVDEFTWWYLVSPEDESRSGWAVSVYLSYVDARD